MDDFEIRFQDKLRFETEQAARLASWLCLIFFPFFSVIDWLSQREHALTLTYIRGTGVALFFLIHLFLRSQKRIKKPVFWSWMILSVGTLDITTMTLVLDGYRSPYYAGVNLLLLGTGLLFPWDAKRMGCMSAWICALYFIPVLAQAGFRIDDWPAFVNNASFLITTAIVLSAAASLSYRLRKESFQQFVNLEKSTRARDAISHELEMRDEFISVASHELKTPITVLKLQNDLFIRNFAQNPDPVKHFERSNAQLQGLLRLIDDMLDISRINSGKLELIPELINLTEVIHDLMEQFRKKLEENRIELRLDLQNDVIGRWDRVRIEQVITNLITNAVRYAPGNPLQVTLREENGQAIVEVEDYGPGIPAALHEKIFERFSRVQSNYKIAGLGLGLYIAREIVEGMHGRIVLQTKPGVGASFKIVLPLNG